MPRSYGPEPGQAGFSTPQLGFAPAGANIGAGVPGDITYRPSWDEIAHTDSQRGTLTANQIAAQGFASPGGLPGAFGAGPIGPAGTTSPPGSGFGTGTGSAPGANVFTGDGGAGVLKSSQDPGVIGRQLLTDILKNGIPEDRLRQMLENTELAYNTAAGKARGLTYGSGAGESGVARLSRGNIEMSRGAGKARNLREFEQFRVDSQMRYFDQWLKNYNNAYAIAQGGAQLPDNGSGWEQFAVELAKIWVQGQATGSG